MVAQKKSKQSKCNHDDFEQTLVLIEEKKVGKMLILRKATLIETCKMCEEEFNYYVAGGILYNVGHDYT